MFGDTDLPLALIMEEIWEWEKRPEAKENEQEEKHQPLTTSKKF